MPGCRFVTPTMRGICYTNVGQQWCEENPDSPDWQSRPPAPPLLPFLSLFLSLSPLFSGLVSLSPRRKPRAQQLSVALALVHTASPFVNLLTFFTYSVDLGEKADAKWEPVQNVPFMGENKADTDVDGDAFSCTCAKRCNYMKSSNKLKCADGWELVGAAGSPIEEGKLDPEEPVQKSSRYADSCFCICGSRESWQGISGAMR